MVNIIISAIIVFSIGYGIATREAQNITNAIIESGTQAIETLISITGMMAVWGGVLNVADKAGISGFVANKLSHILSLLFKGLDDDENAKKAVSMNLVANLLGLGNAATPLGIEAMRSLEKSKGKYSESNMLLLCLLNTCSLEIVPMTVLSLRSKFESFASDEIVIPSMIASAISVLVAVTLWSVFKNSRKRKIDEA